MKSKYKIPLFCPKCKSIMNKRLDKKAWTINKSCFDCMIHDDTQAIIKGTFKEKERKITKGNKELFLNDIKEFAIEYIERLDDKTYVTQDGIIEKWENNISKEKLKEYFEEKLKHA